MPRPAPRTSPSGTIPVTPAAGSRPCTPRACSPRRSPTASSAGSTSSGSPRCGSRPIRPRSSSTLAARARRSFPRHRRTRLLGPSTGRPANNSWVAVIGSLRICFAWASARQESTNCTKTAALSGSIASTATTGDQVPPQHAVYARRHCRERRKRDAELHREFAIPDDEEILNALGKLPETDESGTRTLTWNGNEGDSLMLSYDALSEDIRSLVKREIPAVSPPPTSGRSPGP